MRAPLCVSPLGAQTALLAAPRAPALALAPAAARCAHRADAALLHRRVVRLNEYIQAVNAGAIPSYAPEGATAPPQPQYFESAHGPSTNNYARADGQARPAGPAGKADAQSPSAVWVLGRVIFHAGLTRAAVLRPAEPGQLHDGPQLEPRACSSGRGVVHRVRRR